jgi:hypothetical protein
MANTTTSRKVPDRFAGGALLAINASTADGAGTVYDLRAGYSQFSVQCSGLATGGKVLLQGSLDGSNFTTLGSTAGYTSTSAAVTRSTNSTPVQFVRLSIVTHGSTADVTGWIGVG